MSQPNKFRVDDEVMFLWGDGYAYGIITHVNLSDFVNRYDILTEAKGSKVETTIADGVPEIMIQSAYRYNTEHKVHEYFNKAEGSSQK